MGDVFAVPLEDGRFGVARVVGRDRSHALVVASAHVGPTPPALAEALEAASLREPSLSAAGRLDGRPVPIARYISTPAPEDYTLLGTRKPTESDRRVRCNAYSDWDNLAATVLLQWLREHDPRGAERLVTRWRAERERAASNHATNDRARKRVLTLEGLAKQRLLPAWSGRYPSRVVRAARAILADVIAGLAELGPGASMAQRRAVVKRGVVALNALDGQNGLTITTLEREELCGAFVDIAHAAGWRARGDVTEKWRDW